MRSHLATICAVAVLLVGGPLIASGQRHTDAWAPRTDLGEQMLYLPTGRLLNALALGYEPLLADLLWVRATVLFGTNYGVERTDDWYAWLFHMTNLATDLDPKFRAAYKYGGSMLKTDGVFVDQSNLLFQKGMHELEEEWYFPFAIAMNYFMYKDDRETAARYMRIAAETGSGPFYLRNLAASLISESHDLESALVFMQEERRVVREEKVAAALDLKIAETRYAIGVRDASNAIHEFRRRTGDFPPEPDGVATAGLSLPPDPFGGVWRWDWFDGAVPGDVRSSAYCDVFEPMARAAGLGSAAARACAE